MSGRPPILGLVVLILAGCVNDPGQGPGGTSPSTTPEPVTFATVRFETEFGAIESILYPEVAPETVDLMRDYVAEGYYVGREFTRVVPGHVIQVADRAGNATEDTRRVPPETGADHHFSAGALGIARGAEPGSGGPEFFIMDFATSHLDGNYTVWGQVVSGMDVVRRIARVAALETGQVPGAGDVLTDRTAVDPVAISAAHIGTLTIPAAEAAGFPLVVATNVRAGEFRHSLDWPRTLAPGVETLLSWYMRPYNETQPPAASDVVVRVEGAIHAVEEGDEAAPGIYRWAWNPPRAGAFNATLVMGGTDMATLVVRVG